MTRFKPMFKVLRLCAITLAAAAVLYLAYIGIAEGLAGAQRQRLPELSDTSLGDRILVISPHPDDEALAAGGLIAQSVERGADVRVVIVTLGDGYKRIARRYASKGGTSTAMYLKLGETRAAESREAMRRLGLPADHLCFLGYPDGGMAALWARDRSERTPFMGTNGETSVPYPFACAPGAPYSAANVTRDIESEVTSFSPTSVIFPDGEDQNSDHWAVAAFSQEALVRLGYAGNRYSYLVHRGQYPFPWSYVPRGLMAPPTNVRGLGLDWVSYPVKADTEKLKAGSLSAYASQRRTMAPFLESFVRRNELLAAAKVPEVRLSETASPALDATAMPGIVLVDPTGDTPLRVLDPGLDIRRVALVAEGSRVFVGLETQSVPDRGGLYRVGIRTFEHGSERRIDIELADDVATIRSAYGTGSPSISSARVARAGKRQWCAISSSLVSTSSRGIIGAETFAGAGSADRTAWRAISFR